MERDERWFLTVDKESKSVPMHPRTRHLGAKDKKCRCGRAMCEPAMSQCRLCKGEQSKRYYHERKKGLKTPP
jgi:hypothetical protein